MKTNDFFEAMGNIDASLIERADRKTVKKRPVWKIAAIAASFALLVAVLAVILPMLTRDEPGGNVVGDAIVWDDLFDLFVLSSKGSGEKIFAETGLAEYSFSEIVSAKYEKYEIGNAFPLDKNGEFIGKKLDAIEARNGWRWNIDGKERDVVTVEAEIYEIKGVSPDAAVAVKYLEKGGSQTTEHFYAAVNTEYKCESLSDFFDDLNAAVHMNIGKEVLRREYGWGKRDIKTEKLRIDEAAGGDICKLLLGLDAEAEHAGIYDAVDTKMKGCDLMLRITYAMNSAGRPLNTLYVFDNGYVAISGIGEGVTFFNIGEAVTDIFDAVKREGELIAVLPADPVTDDDGDGLVEVTTSTPVNEVVPE